MSIGKNEMMKLESFADVSSEQPAQENIDMPSPILEQSSKPDIASQSQLDTTQGDDGTKGSANIISTKASKSPRIKQDGDSLDKRVRRRRSLGGENEGSGTGRRKSLRDKVLSNIVDTTMALGEALLPSSDDKVKYAEGDAQVVKQTPPPGENPRKTPARRASFGDHIGRRKSLRDKILGHIIEAAILGVSNEDNKKDSARGRGDENKTAQSQKEKPPSHEKENDVETIPQN